MFCWWHEYSKQSILKIISDAIKTAPIKRKIMLDTMAPKKPNSLMKMQMFKTILKLKKQIIIIENGAEYLLQHNK